MSRAKDLRTLLAEDTCHVMPCCWDALSAKMIAQAGFKFTFMSGFAVSAWRIGAPDVGLISYGEMLDQGRNICTAAGIPVIGDADTGYGNALNVERTVTGYAQAGFASVMIEDQVWPKRCGHTQGKRVVERDEAFDRIKAATYARDACDGDILILARTDARAVHDLGEAIARAKGFADLGADIIFVEAPENEDEMARVCREVPGIHMANMVEGGTTPILPPARLHALGYRFAAYPLTLMSAAMRAIKEALADFSAGAHPDQRIMDFGTLRKTVGFEDYYKAEKRYVSDRR